jgi:hypothetical protein
MVTDKTTWLAADLTLALAAPAAAVPADAQWKVSRLPVGQICTLAATAGTSTWGLSESAAGGSLFHTIEANIAPRGGTITLQVDANAPVSLQATAVPGTSQLLAPLALLPDGGARVLKQLTTGHALRVITSVGTREYSLAGAAAAFVDFGHCVEALHKPVR